MNRHDCPTCHGTRRGVLGGPCGACSGRGTVSSFGALVQVLGVLVFIVMVIALVWR